MPTSDDLLQLLLGGAGGFNFNPNNPATGRGGRARGRGATTDVQTKSQEVINQASQNIAQLIGERLLGDEQKAAAVLQAEQERRQKRLEFAMQNNQPLRQFLTTNPQGQALIESAFRAPTSQEAMDEASRDVEAIRRNRQLRQQKKMGPTEPTSAEDFDARLTVALREYAAMPAAMTEEQARKIEEDIGQRIGRLLHSTVSSNREIGQYLNNIAFTTKEGTPKTLYEQILANKLAGRQEFTGIPTDVVPLHMRAAYYSAITEPDITAENILVEVLMAGEEYKNADPQTKIKMLNNIRDPNWMIESERMQAQIKQYNAQRRKDEAERIRLMTETLTRLKGGVVDPEERRNLSQQLSSIGREVALVNYGLQLHQQVLEARDSKNQEMRDRAHLLFAQLKSMKDSWNIAELSTSKTRLALFNVLFSPTSTITLENMNENDAVISTFRTEKSVLESTKAQIEKQLRDQGLPTLEDLVALDMFDDANPWFSIPGLPRRNPEDTTTVPTPTTTPTQGPPQGRPAAGEVDPFRPAGVPSEAGPMRFDRTAFLAERGVDEATIAILAQESGLTVDEYLNIVYGLPIEQQRQRPATPPVGGAQP